MKGEDSRTDISQIVETDLQERPQFRHNIRIGNNRGGNRRHSWYNHGFERSIIRPKTDNFQEILEGMTKVAICKDLAPEKVQTKTGSDVLDV